MAAQLLFNRKQPVARYRYFYRCTYCPKEFETLTELTNMKHVQYPDGCHTKSLKLLKKVKLL
jgi:predicted nucleic acid-binding Zn ribbon protein